MLLRVDNPIYDGNGNWYTNVTFRSVLKENKTIHLDWGLLPMLKTGQIFCDGCKVDENREKEDMTFDFKGCDFRFFIDRLKLGEESIERPVFCAVIDGVYHKIPVVEVVRAFFARTRTLANELLAANNILRLCQCQLDVEKRSVTVQLSPECPSELGNERWLTSLAWISTDNLARKSWDSFFRYYNFSQETAGTPKVKVYPVFPLDNSFSLTCCYRKHKNNLWIDEIKDIQCGSLDFDEVVGIKYVTSRQVDEIRPPRIINVKKNVGNIEVSNLKESARKQTVTSETDLPGFKIASQPNIRVVKKVLETKSLLVKCVQEWETGIYGTGKNQGFVNIGTGIEFTPTDCKENAEINMQPLQGLQKALAKDLAYNRTLHNYIQGINLVKNMPQIVGTCTTIYELPGNNSFAYIAPGIKRCCAVSKIQTSSSNAIYIIEADRTIYGTNKKWSVSTLLLRLNFEENYGKMCSLIRILPESGHWDEANLNLMKDYFKFKRLKHRHEYDLGWAIRIFNVAQAFIKNF